MSKERELLRRISSHSEARIPTHFIYELQELLAQPETKQEPVAWMMSKKRELLTRLVKSGAFPEAYSDPSILDHVMVYAPKLAQQDPLPPKNLLIEKCDTFLRSLIENNGEGLKELKAFDLETYNKLKEDF